MLTKLCVSLLMLTTMFTAYALPAPLNWNSLELLPLGQFFTYAQVPSAALPIIQPLSEKQLPKPYDFLLTQPIMTLGIKTYYQRTPKIRKPLYVLENAQQKIYSRGIIMIVDNNAQRNDATVADRLHEATVVELGLITMNFSVLPTSVITGVRNSDIPFGALLKQQAVKTHDVDRQFFSIDCDRSLAKNLGCKLGQKLFGRTNTLTNEQGQWVARVVEILTAAKPH